MALHLGTQYQLRLQFGDRPLDGEVVIGNERLEPILSRQRPHITGALPAVGAKTHHLKTHLVPRHARGGQRVGSVGKNEDPLSRQIGRVHRTAVPGQAALADCIGIKFEPQCVDHFGNEVAGGTPTQRHCGNDRLLELAFEPIAGELAHLGCQVHVGIGLGDPQQIMGCRIEWRDHVDPYAHALKKTANLGDIVTTAEAQLGRTNQIHRGWLIGRPRRTLLARLRCLRSEQSPHQLIKRLARAPILLARIGGHLDRNNRRAKSGTFGERTGLILNQLTRAGLRHQQHLRLVAIAGALEGFDHHLRGRAAQIPRLESRPGHWRSTTLALDHREQQIGIGVTLRRVQYEMHIAHRRSDTNRANMGWSFISPQRQLHEPTSS